MSFVLVPVPRASVAALLSDVVTGRSVSDAEVIAFLGDGVEKG